MGERTSQQCRDIEFALSESEARFQQMAEMTGEWLWEQDPAGYYIYSSAAVQQILGHLPEEVLGKHYTHYLTDFHAAEMATAAILPKPFYDLINHHCHKDGHLVLTKSTGLPIFNAAGDLLKWRGVDRDITAEKYFQDALIESERRTRLIIDSSINAIVIVDDAGVVTDWNYHAEKIFGWSAQELIGQELANFVVPQTTRTAFRRALKLYLHTGICPWFGKLLEQTALRRDGTLFPVELSVAPLLIGERTSFSGFIRDISLRKATERQIREAQVNLAIAQSEIKLAQQIQSSLLPSIPFQSEFFAVAGMCLPADKIGGDYFDYLYDPDKGLTMVIADVSGHSVGAALFMVEARSVIRSVSGANSPAEVLGLLNTVLFDDLNKADHFISAFYCRYDVQSQKLNYANAGHCSPLYLSGDRQYCDLLDAEGMILGVRKSLAFEEKELPLLAGDVLLFYTDGLTEAENAQGEFFGVERVVNVLLQHKQQPPHLMINALMTALTSFCQRETFNDDITLLVFQRR